MQDTDQLLKLILVEDHSIFLEGLQSLLSRIPWLQVEAQFGEGASALEYIGRHEVDLVFLDIGLPGRSGMEICQDMLKKRPDIRVIALSNHSEKHIISAMLGAGAAGYLLKNASLPDLENAIRQVMQGQTALSEDIRKIVFSQQGNLTGPPRLTRREKEILELVSDGMTTAAMAGKLFVSTQTIETHRANLMKKFEVSNSINLVRKAMELGMLGRVE